MRIIRTDIFVSTAIACFLAGCSSNAGFGTPVSGQPPINNGYQNQPNAMVSPLPSGALGPGEVPGGPPGGPDASPVGSPSPTPTPVPNTLTIIGATLRLAHDGSASDPVKAPRLLELSFALQNTTRNAVTITSLNAASDKTVVVDRKVSVTAPSNQTSEVAVVAMKTADDPLKYKELTLKFFDGAKKTVGSVKLEVPQPDNSYTALDEKHPKGFFSIDGAQISRIDTGSGLHYECTFTLTNAGTTQVSITQFVISPPKGNTARAAIPFLVPPRSVSGFTSVVLPYNGKSLPPGTYVISAQQSNGLLVAKASAVLL